MRTLAFDGRMGASGDMLLAALLAAGADRAALDPVEDALDVRYEVGDATRNGIAGTTVSVLLGGAEDSSDHSHDHSDHSHDHADHSHHHSDHSHDHADHDHAADSTPAEGHGPHRTLGEVIDIVADMSVPERVEADAVTIFELLAAAESGVHGTDPSETTFHEVGADDAIADVVGVCLLLDDLGPDRVVTTPLATGGGAVEMSHGTYPVPVPAVVELAERADWRLRGGPVEAELLTPTGAAILAHFAEGIDSLPDLSVESSGYGIGGYRFDDHPNVLRAIVGESEAGLSREPITVLETNLDDATPEVLGGLQETLADAGAVDVSVVPMTMKKSRPGHLVKVVAAPEDAGRVARRLAEETGTLGVREHGAGHRWVADREQHTADVSHEGTTYEVNVKVASADGAIYDLSAEYDDALAVARETGLPVREIARRAEQAIRERVDGS